MAKKIKQKLKSVKPQGSSRIKAPERENLSQWYYSDSRHFAFSFTMMPKSNYDLEAPDKSHLVHLIKQLKKLSELTWGEIKTSNRHSLGSEIIHRESIKATIPQYVTDDVKILAFRYYGKRPFLGYRSGKIFHILFIDHNFTLYNHG